MASKLLFFVKTIPGDYLAIFPLFYVKTNKQIFLRI